MLLRKMTRAAALGCCGSWALTASGQPAGKRRSELSPPAAPSVVKQSPHTDGRTFDARSPHLWYQR
jgi:hypothetical protein